MKKNIVILIWTVFVFLLLSGCATSEPVGLFYTDTTVPITATSAKIKKIRQKIGSAGCNSYLGLVATGDASISTAAKRANIKKINYVEWKANNFLGLIGTYKVLVYGE